VNVRRHLFSAVVSVAVLLCLWLPLAFIVIDSLNANELLATWGGATTRWYGEAVDDESVRSGLRATLTIAGASTALSLALAVSGVLWYRRAGLRGRRAFDALTYLRIMLPEVVFAVALFLLFARLDLQLGTAAVIVGHTVSSSAYATLILRARLSVLDPALEDAAADLGASPWRVFKRVTLPGLLPGMLAAGLLAFTFSFDDVVTSLFLIGTDDAPLPVVILSKIRFRIEPEISAIAILVLVFTVALFAAAFAVVVRLARVSGRSLALPEER